MHTLKRTSGSNHGGVLIKSTTSPLIAGDITVPDKVGEERAGLPSSFHCTFPINPQVRLLLGFNQASVFWSWRESMLKKQRRERELKEWLQCLCTHFIELECVCFLYCYALAKQVNCFNLYFGAFCLFISIQPFYLSENWTHVLGVASALHVLCRLSCYRNTNLWDNVSSTF